MTIDNKLATDNIIILTKYIHDILLTATTPYNEQDLFQWYDNNKEQLQRQFKEAHDTDASRKEHHRQAIEHEHRRIEQEQLRIETNRTETLKTHKRSAAVARCAKARLESASNLPQKQISSNRKRIHRALQAELRARNDQHKQDAVIQTKRSKEQRRSLLHQTRKQQLDDQEILTQQEPAERLKSYPVPVQSTQSEIVQPEYNPGKTQTEQLS